MHVCVCARAATADRCAHALRNMRRTNALANMIRIDDLFLPFAVQLAVNHFDVKKYSAVAAAFGEVLVTIGKGQVFEEEEG